MNGLANAILTLLLSWLRIIINRFWNLLNSEAGTNFYAFLSQHWPVILLVLCVGGFVLDRLIYFIRWRPDLVWRRRRQSYEDDDLQEEVWPTPQTYQNAYAPAAGYREATPAGQDGYSAAAREPAGYDQPYPQWNNAPAAETAVYHKGGVDHSAYKPPMDDVDPVFDEDQAIWAESDLLVNDPTAFQADSGNIYAAPAQVSEQYVLDAQAGFAPPVAPQQLYAASSAAAEAQPVHPGLDADVLRRSIGLGYGEEEPSADPYVGYTNAPAASGFTPFTQQASEEDSRKKRSNPFLNLMRLVGDDAAKPSIRDLHSTVDVRTAFHEPVFPQNTYTGEEEP